MAQDTKKIASMIIGSGGDSGKSRPEKGEDPMEASVEGSDDHEGKMAAAKEIIDAAHSKDPSALKTALENFMAMCGNE